MFSYVVDEILKERETNETNKPEGESSCFKTALKSITKWQLFKIAISLSRGEAY